MSAPAIHAQTHRWAALWAIIIGYFMILVDATIVTVAIPTISNKLQADTDTVIWVTSAYLLAYAVPLLVTGRLGDQFGPKKLYQLGLALFTLASLGCGLSTSIGLLIAARVVQGVGAALMTPQTLTVITHLFPRSSADRPCRSGVQQPGPPHSSVQSSAASSWERGDGNGFSMSTSPSA